MSTIIWVLAITLTYPCMGRYCRGDRVIEVGFSTEQECENSRRMTTMNGEELSKKECLPKKIPSKPTTTETKK